MSKLVLVRHGESIWNKENKFTGWTDVELSKKGREEAKQAGQILKKANISFSIAYTSVLKRAYHTLDYILKEMNISIPVIKAYQLNERHYGALQGLNKAETALKYGPDQVRIWRRSYKTKPPLLKEDDKRNPAFDPLYKNVLKENIPLGESLEDTMQRVVPFYQKEIEPKLKKDENVLVVAHGNSLRSLIKYIENISDKEIMNVEIPLGIPLYYEMDKLGNIRKEKN